jgi:AraC-like DNA-binding protein/mannose-6-phosphate isomerase-like protein (cupin superfamily)
MSACQRLIFDDIAPSLAFHAAWAAFQGREPGVQLHTHDFYEMMYVIEGEGVHRINGDIQTLAPGDLVAIRPDDRHTVRAKPGGQLHFINIAYPAETWRGFVTFTGQGDVVAPLETTEMPPVVPVPGEARAECASAFHRALRAFHEAPSRLELCRFWTGILPLLTHDAVSDRSEGVDMPAWLARACRAMRDPEALAAGLPRLIELVGVSPAHLSRVLRAATGKTPTEYINELRLQRAAMVLTTTSQEIIDIAGECGFENLSYFYRLFRAYFGKTPRDFRLSARHVVLP